MIIVCDASPLIALATCHALDLLETIFQKVYVTQEVFDEVAQNNKPFATELIEFLSEKIYQVDFDITSVANDDATVKRLNVLDLGELSAFNLYQQLNANYLLIDEKLGREIAHQLDFKIIGSLGILVLAKRMGHIPAILPYVEILESSPIFISHSLIQSTLKHVGELD